MVYRDLSIFSGTAHPELAQAVCRYLGVPLGKAEVVKFSNENIFPKINQNVREHDVFVIQPTYPNVSDSILELLIMIDALKRASASRITAVVPYFSYARSDKKDQPRVPITARLIADMLQTAGANRVLTIDLHAGQVQGFFNIPVDELTAMQPLLRDYVIGMEMIDPVVVAGDLGFAKRARNFADMIGASVAFVEKRRLGNNSSSESLGVIGDVRGKSAIIIDDEIDTAGSIVGAAEIVAQGRRTGGLCGVHPRAADGPGRRAAAQLADPGADRDRHGRAADAQAPAEHDGAVGFAAAGRSDFAHPHRRVGRRPVRRTRLAVSG